MILCPSVSLKEFRVRWDEMIGLAVWLMNLMAESFYFLSLIMGTFIKF